MKNFWEFKNKLESNEAELILHGAIVSEAPWFSEDVTCYRNFIDELNALGNKDVIKVYINSGGGDVCAAHAIFTQLKLNKAKIHVIIEGICASAATVVAMAGDVIDIANNAVMMVHNPQAGTYGYYEQVELEKIASVLATLKTSIIAAYKTRLSKTEDEIVEIMDNETWYTAQEAVDSGFADHLLFDVVNHVLVGNCLYVNNIPFDVSGFKNFPNSLKNQVTDKKPVAFFDSKNNKDTRGEDEVDIKNVDDLMKNYPDLVNQIINEATGNAATQERERLKAIDEIAANLPQEMVTKAKYENFISAESLVFAAMQTNNLIAKAVFCNMLEDSSQSGVGDIGGEISDDMKNVADKKANRVSRLANYLNSDSRRKKQ